MRASTCRPQTALLMRGFTSARDLGGPVFGLKRAIDTGLIPGPRGWPSGAFVSHGGGTDAAYPAAKKHKIKTAGAPTSCSAPARPQHRAGSWPR